MSTAPPELLLWDPYENTVTDNVVEDSRIADIAVGSVSSDPATLGNCFAGNTFTTSAPADLETLAPCDGEGAGDWTAGALDLGALHRRRRERPAECRLRGGRAARAGSAGEHARRGDGAGGAGHRHAAHRRRRRHRRPRRPGRSDRRLAPARSPRSSRSPRSIDRPRRPSSMRAAAGPQGRVGQFVVECGWSHSSFDDPIVHPGHAGASHRHDFFGNTTTSATSTYEQLLDAADDLSATPGHGGLLGAVAARRRRHADGPASGDGVLPGRPGHRPGDRRGVPA